MSIAGLASGKRSVSASGKATTYRSTTSAHGLPRVSYSNGSSIQSSSYQPLSTRTCSPAGSDGLRDERELRVERQRDVADKAAKELVSDRTCGSFGNGAEQVPAAEPRAGAVDVYVRHESLPTFDASARTSPRRRRATGPRGPGAGCRRGPELRDGAPGELEHVRDGLDVASLQLLVVLRMSSVSIVIDAGRRPMVGWACPVSRAEHELELVALDADGQKPRPVGVGFSTRFSRPRSSLEVERPVLTARRARLGQEDLLEHRDPPVGRGRSSPLMQRRAENGPTSCGDASAY